MVERPSRISRISKLSRRNFLKIAGAAWVAALGPNFSNPEIESANRIGFDGDRILTVNDERIFPLILFYLPGPDESATWEKVADAGFNTVAGHWVNDHALGMAEEHGLFTVANTEYAFENYVFDQERLERLAKSPSLLAWYGPNEPSPNLKRDLHRQFFEQLNQTDPHHPVWMNYLDFWGWLTTTGWKIPPKPEDYPGNKNDLRDLPGNPTFTEFQNWLNSSLGAKIVSFGGIWRNYAGNDISYGALEKIYLDNLGRGKLGNKAEAYWLVLPAFSEVDFSFESFWFQAIEAIANGATGLAFWGWPYGCTSETCPDYPGTGGGYTEHWDKLARLAGELTSLRPGLTGVNQREGRTDNGVAFRINRGGGKQYVFAARSAPEETSPARTAITGLPANTKFTEVVENRTVATDWRGWLYDEFDPLSAKVYINE